MKILLQGICNGCLIVAIIGILAYLNLFNFSGGVFIDGNTIRLQSTMQYANTTALILGIGFLISCHFTQESESIKSSLKYFLLSSVLLYSLTLTFSRGVLLVFIPLLIVYFIMLKSSKLIIYCILLFSVIVPAAYMTLLLAKNGHYLPATFILPCSVIILYFFFHVVNSVDNAKKRQKTRNRSRLKYSLFIAAGFAGVLVLTYAVYLSLTGRIPKISIYESTFVCRYIYLEDSIKALVANPLSGIGPGNWVFKQYIYQTAQYNVRYVHNGLIQFALDSGIFAAIAFICILMVFYYISVKRYIITKDRNTLLFLVLVTFMFLHSLMDVDFSYVSVLIILAGVISVSVSEEHKIAVAGKDSFVFRTTKELKLAGMDIKKSKYILRCILILMIAASMFFSSGQVLPYVAENNIKKNMIDSALNIYYICRYLRPLDNKVYMQIARCRQLIDMNDDEIMMNLRNAYLLNPNDPTNINEIVKFLIAKKDYMNAFDFSFKRVQLSPFDYNAYYHSLESLTEMYTGNDISEKDYIDYCTDLLMLYMETKQKINPLVVYLQRDKWIESGNEFKANVSLLMDRTQNCGTDVISAFDGFIK